MNIKTRYQSSRYLSESTESQRFSGRHRQNPRAACPRRRPHVASALITQATTRLGAALTPPASARPLPRSIFASPRPPSSPASSHRSAEHPSSPLPAPARSTSPFATAATPLTSPSLTAPACAHQQRPVSHRAAYDLAGASPRASSPWPERHRPPLQALASALSLS